jgi:hypothetical protein
MAQGRRVRIKELRRVALCPPLECVLRHCNQPDLGHAKKGQRYVVRSSYTYMMHALLPIQIHNGGSGVHCPHGIDCLWRR